MGSGGWTTPKWYQWPTLILWGLWQLVKYFIKQMIGRGNK